MTKVSYGDIADYFIALSNTTGNLITNLKLQKLVYYTQAWHLAMYDKPVIPEYFEAWIHGPVLVSLYSEYKGFKWHPIEREDLDDVSMAGLRDKFGSDLCALVEQVVEQYFGMTAYQMERLVHSEEPWRRAREGLNADEPSHNIIKNDWMRDYYCRFLADEPEAD